MLHHTVHWKKRGANESWNQVIHENSSANCQIHDSVLFYGGIQNLMYENHLSDLLRKLFHRKSLNKRASCRLRKKSQEKVICSSSKYLISCGILWAGLNIHVRKDKELSQGLHLVWALPICGIITVWGFWENEILCHKRCFNLSQQNYYISSARILHVAVLHTFFLLVLFANKLHSLNR